MRSSQGFSLLEIVIVMTIIGLLIGGILAGQSLVKAAEMRALIRQVEEIQAAVLLFKDKYRALPGDMPNASAFFGATAQPEQVTNGDGDRIIDTWNFGQYPELINQAWLNWAQEGSELEEFKSVFDHLAAAGLLQLKQYDETVEDSYEPGIGIPKAAFQSEGEVFNGEVRATGILVGWEPGAYHVHKGHKIRPSACFRAPWERHVPTHQCGMNPADAASFDAKMDDGKPYSGMVYITGPTYVMRVPGSTWDETNLCGDAASNAYIMYDHIWWYSEEEGRNCSIDIDASF